MYMDTVIVSGAGSEQVNGTYVESGTFTGRPQYLLNGGGPDDRIFWGDISDGWTIINDGVAFYATSDGEALAEDVEFPWLATVWTIQGWEGELPVPTVTLFVPEPEPEPETENTFGLPAETVALITSRFGSVANFLRLRNQGQI